MSPTYARVASLCLALSSAAHAQDWPGWGGPTAGNQRQATQETIISPATVGGLHTKWTFTANGNITATPTVAGGAVYLTDDWGGVYSLSAKDGVQSWMHWMSDFTGSTASASRSSPALYGRLMIVADRHSGNVVALDRATGNLVWKTVVETNPYVTLTASPAVHDGVVYIGTSSNEEYEVSVSPSYVPTFRGSLTALDAATGAVKWQTYMVPPGYTGGAIWGSGFPVLPAGNLIFVATGNNYTLPPAAAACADGPAPATAHACLAPADYVDSVVALDLTSGKVKWGRRLQGLDTFNLNCTSSQPAQPCPAPTGKDYDFGSAPNLLAATIAGAPATLVGAGQKSGTYWALNPADGAIVWRSAPAPGGVRGGILWGSAVDASHVYVAENNASHLPYRPKTANAPKTTGASWAALDSSTGAVLWQTVVPAAPGHQPGGAEGTLSVANGVVFGGTTGGTMAALDAGTGAILWSFQAASSVTCGPAIVDGVVYWGVGDTYGTPGKTLYAFTTAK